jgi:hypothetical protein
MEVSHYQNAGSYFEISYVSVSVYMRGGNGQLVRERPLESPPRRGEVTRSSQASLLVE